MADAEKKSGYGDFGNLSGQYKKARRKYPEEVINFLFSSISTNDKILDLGCGTGISTRQIASRNANVLGCDKDLKMVREAAAENDGVIYVVAHAEAMPFRNSYFNAITAFSAFHWFVNDTAISEIKRVLKLNGIFLVANKNDVGDFKKIYRKIFEEVVGSKLPDKAGYDPSQILVNAGFSDIHVKILETSEYFTIDDALEYRKTASTWNIIPANLKQKITDALKKQYAEISVNGVIERKLVIETVTAKSL